MALLSPTGTAWLTIGVGVVLVVASVSFALTPVGSESLNPVTFEDTVSMGGTGVDTRRAEAEGFLLPRAEVFYSGYRYVVGYVGIETAASELGDQSARRQFGDPLAVYVSDFSTISPTVTDDGYVVPERGQAVGWTPVESAHFVIDSDARIPSGPIVLPFSDPEDAEQFAAAHGGRVVDWATVTARAGDPLPAKLRAFERSIDERHAWATRTAEAAAARRDRPVSVVVGNESTQASGPAPNDAQTAPTIEAGVAAAPPDTTVYVPEGTYEVDRIVLNRSVTLAGAGPSLHTGDGTTIRGDGNGSVVVVQADGASVVDLSVTGVGNVGSRGRERRNESVDWDTTVQLAYGYGDAGIVLDGATGASVAGVRITTPASGVIVRDSSDSVLTGLTVRGAETAREGFMSVVLIGAPSVVEDSTFRGGRDGVYTHRADGSVIRDNYADPGRYGVHEMYTSDSLVANNTVRNAQTGIIVMTRPTDNIVVSNDVRQSTYGVIPAGGGSYYARNVVVDNDYGIGIAGDRNAFVGNVVVDNRVGARANEILPANWVIRNDFAANDRAVTSDIGPFRTWSHGGVGNYWGALPIADGDDNGVYDRPYRPTGTVDSRIGAVGGATTLAQSPASVTLRRVQGAVSGLRQSGVVDTHARTRPFHPAVLNSVRNGTDPTNQTVGRVVATSSTAGGVSA
ncbi:MAG: NosD domain-containing protein [Halobellus sp.]|uniref:NosD domain-containing protein n=1 Tax=Halobellus sp. TaxID=1979212 RepID=UPI0035D48EC4